MIYIKRLFSLIIGISLFIILSFFTMIEILFIPIKQLISYVICGNSTKYYTWFGWVGRPIIRLLQKIDLIDKDIE